ncbi:hypothetical protein DICVIV_11506, partial [Dictyocaulus viviparus]
MAEIAIRFLDFPVDSLMLFDSFTHHLTVFPRNQLGVMAATQTTTIETVNVVRPLKVISLICLCIAIALSIISLCSTWWLRSGSFRTGLFLECTSSTEPSHAAPLREAPLPGKCHPPARDS